MSKTETKPHRRLSLTLPTQPSEPSPQRSENASLQEKNQQDVQSPPISAPELSTVRVMAYLTPEEARWLDDLWIEMRRNNSRASKSDILRAALEIAILHRTELTATIEKQQVSTLSRQRGRKPSN